ncbi:MAG: kinase/pyrophosphorylase [Sphingomonadaceae bacterium]|uniref:pyruvate, water dikinase regulatory protein n=1 Tax=Thermaurantiacus sp. TaxID=2820283 RepID=UPI00298F3AFC|nr:pyruvate, water dikinase regulatory protein [Thermaurantiacus sp.]MCS6987657.1 kinase/pyrophosphorylase [Sphingomonadaceae bacterium]MDW8415258.1 pyruvate, water dikinase regulatory protein [Thermaurantiacus sp.]
MRPFHLHLVSDSTGETLDVIAKAALAQFEQLETQRHFWPLVRSEGHLERVMREVEAHPGLVLHTLVARRLRDRLEESCQRIGVPALAVLDPIVFAVARLVGQAARPRPGGRHVMDAAYFQRIDAINYTLAHDDGQGPEGWDEADFVLVGVSRSSKTPTSIYLANRGYKVANTPLVPGRPPDPRLDELRRPRIVGLTMAPERLVQIRRARLASTGAPVRHDYVDPECVAREVAEARRHFLERGWPVIDVSRRSIEETAAAILTLAERP